MSDHAEFGNGVNSYIPRKGAKGVQLMVKGL